MNSFYIVLVLNVKARIMWITGFNFLRNFKD
jgi:hypothetical protein